MKRLKFCNASKVREFSAQVGNRSMERWLIFFCWGFWEELMIIDTSGRVPGYG